MKREIIFTNIASNDLTNISNYLFENWDMIVLSNFIESLTSILSSISQNPELYPIIHLPKQIRKCILTKHNTLFFSINQINCITVLAIFDSRQNPEKLIF